MSAVSPTSVLPSSSRERKALCNQLRLGLLAADAERIAHFENIVDVLMPIPPAGNLEQFNNAITPAPNLEKLECLLSGGEKLSDWTKQLRPYNISPVCGLVWSTSYIGYRCKTCSRNPNMSLCADCFRAGNHEGHDSNMFKSSSGGTCDCGNSSVMAPSGFCTFHGRSSTTKPPRELIVTAPYIIFRYLWRLNVFFRHCYFINYQHRILSRSNRGMDVDPPEEFYFPMSIAFAEKDIEKMCDWLETICNVGYSAKEEIVNALLDESSYARANAQIDTGLPPAVGASLWARSELLAGLKRTITLFSPSLAEEFYTNKDNCTSLLDELFRWLLVTRLPTRFLNVLLSLLPLRSYAGEMTRRLADQYPIVAALLCLNLKVRSDGDLDRESKKGLAQRFLHVTVQLYSNSDLAHLAVFECSGLSTQLSSLLALLRYCSIKRRRNNQIPVVDTENRILGHAIAYWPLVSDLYNLIVHRTVANKMLSDKSLIKKWCETLSLCHAMNSNQRFFRNHIELDSETAFSTAYSLELEACSAPLWLVAAQIEQNQWSDLERLQNASIVVECLVGELQRHIDHGKEPSCMPCSFEFSFHLPLHRALSALLHSVRATYNAEVVVKLLPQEFLIQLVRPLIQLQALRAEIGVNMWTRNGHLLRTKALAYAQTNFASSFIDLDISVIQAAVTAGLSPNHLVSFVLEQFHVLDSLSIYKPQSGVLPSSDVTSAFFGDQRYNEMTLLESSLLLLVQLAQLHLLPSMNIKDADGRELYRRQLRREVVSQLCLSDRTYSEIIDSIPQRHIASVEMASSHDNTGTSSDDVDACIADVADFKEPSTDANGQVLSGTYVLRDSVWLNGCDFDPAHVILRAYQRKDFQTCMDRYCAVVARASSVASSTCSKQLWPPFCSPNIPTSTGNLTKIICAQSRVLHAAIFSLLFRYFTEIQSNSIILPDQIVATALYLLELGIFEASKLPREREAGLPSPIQAVLDCDFANGWFQSDDIFENLCRHIDFVKPPDTQYQQDLRQRRLSEMPSSDDDSQWPGGGLDRASLTSLFQLPSSWRDCGDHEMPVNQSLISLLCNIRQKFNEKALPKSCSSSGSRVFDCFTYITSLLEKISNSNEMCKRYLETVENTLGFSSYVSDAIASSVSSSSSSSIDASKAAAKRREKILALMAKQQRQFLEQMVVEGEVELIGGDQSSSLSELSVSIDQPSLLMEMAATSSFSPLQRPAQSFDCCICNVSGISTIERPFVVISMCQPSKVLHHRYDSEGPFDLPATIGGSSHGASEKHLESVPLSDHSAGHARQCLVTSFQDFWRASQSEENAGLPDTSRQRSVPNPSPLLIASSAFWPVDVHVTLCGSGSVQHAAHFDCHHNYLRVNRHGNESLNDILEQLFAMPGLGANPDDMEIGALAAAVGDNEFLPAIDDALGPLGNEHVMTSRELGEYGCPLCRQLANCAVPLVPVSLFIREQQTSESLPDPHAFDSAERLRQIAQFLSSSNSETVLSRRRNLPARAQIFLALRQFQSDISLIVQQSSQLTNDTATVALLRSSGPLGLSALLVHVVRVNFEFSRLRQASSEQCCPCQALYPLVACVAACCYVVLNSELRTHYHRIYSLLIGLNPINSSVFGTRHLPLLAYDPSTLLMLFSLSALPFGSSSAYITALTQSLFNLKVVQAIIKIARLVSPSERETWRNAKENSLVSRVLSMAENAKLFASSDTYSSPIGISSTVWSPQALSDAVRCSCLPFLELATTLTCCLNQMSNVQQPCYFESIRKPCGVAEKFFSYVTALGLDAGVAAGRGLAGEVDPWEFAWFALDDDGSMIHGEPSVSAIRAWFDELVNSTVGQRLVSTVIAPMHGAWFRPCLLRVPNIFDQLFHAVRAWRCNQCHRIPTRAGVCLVCGHVVCFREVCCNRDSIFEAVWHARQCGAGTALFLVVPTSCVFVIRGPRYTVWGSPYLDSHGEEDRDLKRGRPLRASVDRMAILERQWLSHSFDRQLRQWQWHSNRL